MKTRVVIIEVEGVRIRLTPEQVAYIDKQKSTRPKLEKVYSKKLNEDYWRTCTYPHLGFYGNNNSWDLVLFCGYGVGHKVLRPDLSLYNETDKKSGWVMKEFDPIKPNP